MRRAQSSKADCGAAPNEGILRVPRGGSLMPPKVVVVADRMSADGAKPEWWNWQTRTFEGRVAQAVRVQVPPPAPFFRLVGGPQTQHGPPAQPPMPQGQASRNPRRFGGSESRLRSNRGGRKRGCRGYQRTSHARPPVSARQTEWLLRGSRGCPTGLAVGPVPRAVAGPCAPTRVEAVPLPS